MWLNRPGPLYCNQLLDNQEHTKKCWQQVKLQAGKDRTIEINLHPFSHINEKLHTKTSS